MPLFGNKFSPKKGVARKWPSLSNLNLDASTQQTEFGLDYGPIKIKLGDNEIVFDKGQWISEAGGGGSGTGSQRNLMNLQQENHHLHEENNLLKLKLEILLDMVRGLTHWALGAFW